MLTEEKKKERLLGIGGSDVAALVGQSKYMSALDLYLIKIGEKESEEISNEAIEVGNDLESYVANKYAERMGVEIEKPEKALVHPDYPFMRCNLDFIVKGSTIVGECKTTGFLGENWGEEGTDIMPTPYLLQCAHNAIVSEPFYGTTRVDLPVFSGGIGGLKHRIYTYQRNEKLEKKLIKIERKFWQENVEKRIPPSPLTYKEEAMLWPEGDDEVKIASLDVVEVINSLKDIKLAIKNLEDEEDAKKMELCKFLKNASILLDNQGSKLLSWKTQESKRLNVYALKKAFPEIYNQFLKPSTNRILRIA
jgi:putative phage-type endonuclease